MKKQALMVLPAVLLLVSGCDKLTDTSRAVQTVTRTAFEDTKSSWKDFFTYHPPLPEPLPQTRYCYQMQSDIVCYDSEQTLLTSKLIGYQDGEAISWVQPGGGALGASGGEPIALRPQIAASATISPTMQNNFNKSNSGFPTTGSNYTSTSIPPTAGQISVINLPPELQQKKPVN